MRLLIKSAAIALALGTISASAMAADAPAPAAAAAPAYSTTDTDIGTLIDTPETKAILDRLMPGFSGNDQVAMARPMTLRAIQQFAPDQIKTEILDQIDAELARLPAK